jgi:hypothetical protein
MAQAKRQYGTNTRTYDEFNEIRDHRYNQDARRAKRLLQNRMSILTPTAFQTISQSPSPHVLLENDFQILGVSALKASNQSSAADKYKDKDKGTNAQTFVKGRGSAQV